MNKRSWPLLAASLLAPAAFAQSLDCLIQPNKIVQIGSPVPGLIDEMLVDRGDLISEGQVVARLAASVERATRQLALARAKAEAEVEAASQSTEFARRELDRAQELARKNFVSANYVDKAATEASLAKSKLTQARERRDVAARELQVADAQLAQRTIRSPIAGVVVERHLAAGERVEDKPIMRIATINPLRVEVVVPASLYGQVRKGIQGTVTPDFRDAEPRLATVTVVDRIVDPASNTFRVRLEMPNPDGAIPPGLRCKIDMGLRLPEPPAKPASGKRPAGAIKPVAAASAS